MRKRAHEIFSNPENFILSFTATSFVLLLQHLFVLCQQFEIRDTNLLCWNEMLSQIRDDNCLLCSTEESFFNLPNWVARDFCGKARNEGTKTDAWLINFPSFTRTCLNGKLLFATRPRAHTWANTNNTLCWLLFVYHFIRSIACCFRRFKLIYWLLRKQTFVYLCNCYNISFSSFRFHGDSKVD